MMKKITKLTKTLLVAAGLLVGTSAWASSTNGVAGNADNDALWANGTDAWYTKDHIMKGNGTFTFTFTTTNKTTEAYYGWSLFISNDGNADMFSQNWMICRAGLADAWGTAYSGEITSTNTYATANPEGAGITSALNGSTVTATITRNSTGITVVSNVTPATENAFTITNTYTYSDSDNKTADLYLCLAADNAYVNIKSTSVSTDYNPGTTVTYDFSKMSDLDITSSGRAWKPNGSNEYLVTNNSDLLKYFFAFTTAGDPQIKNGNLTNTSGNASQMAIMNLKAGDKVTFYFTKGTNGGLSFRNWTTAFTATDYQGITSEETYMAVTDGNLAVQISKTTTYINKIVISTSTKEAVPAPTISAMASGANREITITSSVSNISSDVTIYYTTDGSTPTTTSTKYTAPFTIDETKTFKAISISNSSALTESEVASLEVVVTGETTQLATPTITRTSPTSVTITSDQSAVFGTPNVTIHYTYGDENGTFEGSKNLTIGADATITAYASYTGYTDSEEASLAVAPYPVIELENVSRITSYTSGALNTEDDHTGSKCTYNPLVIDGVQWGNNIYFQPYDSSKGGFGFRSGNTWYSNSSGANFGWMMVEDTQAGDIVVVECDQAPSTLVNATYSAKYSYGNHHAYIADADGNMELRLARIGSGSSAKNNTFYGVQAYRGKVKATMGTNGFTTFSSAYNLDLANLPAGVKAYTATLTETTLSFAECTKAVPAATGLLLAGDASTSYDIPVTAEAVDAVAGNALIAAVTATSKQSTEGGMYYFVMKAGSDPLAFAPISTTKAVTIPAGKAYVELNTASGARSLTVVFGDETTGIQSVANIENATENYYNLSGQRVANPAKGLYIVNGKKVIIK